MSVERSPDPILPGATIGVVGSGQLGRMLAFAAHRLGYRVHVLGDAGEPGRSPAGQAADHETVAPYDDRDAVAAFCRACDVVTFEFESVPPSVAEIATGVGVPARPGADALATVSDRIAEKSFCARHGLATTKVAFVPDGGVGLAAALDEVGVPAIVKTATAGYDGKGQWRIDEPGALAGVAAELGERPAVVEAVVDLASEVSVIVARTAAGDVAAYPPIRNDHRNHILDVSRYPSGLDPALEATAAEMGRAAVEGLGLVGLCAVELFVTTDGRVLVNELAPRPHNSGHLTIEAAATDQFSQTIRAICGLPLGSTDIRPSAMANLLGDLWDGGEPPWTEALRLPGVRLHLYGKESARPGRKMGHLTVVADEVTDARERVLAARRGLAHASPTEEHHVHDRDDRPREECGVFGVVTPSGEAARLTFFGLYALQHRGQEGAGIVTYDGVTAHVHKSLGLVSQVFREENLRELTGGASIGHTRYSTTGSVHQRNVQPYVLETIDGPLALGHNGNLVNAPQLRRELLERGVGLQSSSDSEVMIHLLAGAGGPDWVTRIRILMAKAEGAYSLTLLTRDGVYGVRDPWGLRPLALGELEGGGYALASESCAFAPIGGRLVREIEPGEIVHLTEDGYEVHPGAPPRKLAFCTFEHIYFARPDSSFGGRLVHQVRQSLGRKLAHELPVEADMVIAVPDSGTPHAIGYAAESGIPFSEGLIKSRYIGRTFIEPSPELRRAGVAMKFNPLVDNLDGQRVVLVDDSIVRGTTSGPLVKLLRDAGAREVHLRVSCPPICYPCFMGVDMASREELIAANHSVEEIRAHVGADSLAYLSLESMMEALQPDTGFCNACFTGTYPFDGASQFVELQGRTTFAEVIG
ncbi:MAG: amidophosphoribosyltransferase [Actinomycetota bacterium]|nr:amidophosphoribosyltransferase [Actinomycetota bacterium]